MPAIAVYEVTTFYNMYNQQPVGKFKLNVCANLPCQLRDGYKALRRIYMDTHQYDKTWCLCNTLAFLKKAEPDDQDRIARHRTDNPGFALARRPLGDRVGGQQSGDIEMMGTETNIALGEPLAFMALKLPEHLAHRQRAPGDAPQGKRRQPRAFGQAVGQLEDAVCAITPGMDDPLGNAFMVEVKDLFAQDEVFEQHWAAGA